MDFQTLLTFAVVAGITIITPGPAVLLSLRNGSSFGLHAVLWSALGNVAGVFCVSAAAMCGLGAVINSSVVIFSGLKLLGAGYLLYLGVRSLRSRSTSLALDDCPPFDIVPGRSRLFMEAFLTAATNPKALLFFTALFPQFIHAGQPLLHQFLSLTGVFMLIAYSVHIAYAAAASRTRVVLQRPSFSTWLNRLLGITFIAFAIALLTFRRPTG